MDLGRVRLAGTVRGQVEQALIGSNAGSVMSFGVENQLQVEGQERGEPRKDATGI